MKWTVAAVVTVALLAALIWANAPPSPLPAATKADSLIVEKRTHRLLAYSHGNLVRSYPVSLGREPLGAKSRQGDRRTPEGRYMIDNHNPASAFDRALHVSYPSRADLEQARSGGYDPGGEIMVLGIHNGLEWIGVTSLISAATAIECANTQTFGMRFNPKPRTRSINQPGKPGKRRRRRTEVRHLNQSVHFSTAINEQFSSGVDSSAAVPPRGLVKYYGKQVEDTAAHVTFESRSD